MISLYVSQLKLLSKQQNQQQTKITEIKVQSLEMAQNNLKSHSEFRMADFLLVLAIPPRGFF